jgi:polyhydroxyalkanoate synthase
MLADCVDEITEGAPARKICVAGHSLGGTLAAIHTAYRGEPIGGLVLLEAPLQFAEASGAFAPLIELGVPASAVMPSADRVPGSLLNFISATAAPDAFQLDRYLDYLASLTSRHDFETHCRVERWTLDELPLPGKLFEDVMEQLYREDRFMRGELTLDGVRLHPRDITTPLFVVYEPASRIIPRASIIPFYDAVGSWDKELVPYFGDSGVALKHVGPLVGDSAHARIWPQIFDWLERLSAY